MTPRFFYTDPLAAAWMMRHHNMHIVDKYADEIEEAYRKDPSVWLDPPYYIRSDSLHLLEPQKEDVLYSNYKGGIGIEQIISDERQTTGKFLVEKRGARIIQRNGIPFMWPESEES